ncbi:MAG: PAS domain-containing protein, partial [Janthinobacterium lividum]
MNKLTPNMPHSEYSGPLRPDDAWPARWCDLLGDLLCALNSEGCITRVNAVWNKEVVLEAPEHSFQEHSFLDLVHQDDAASVRRALARIPLGVGAAS